MIWHQKAFSEIIEHLKSDAGGLTASEARKRLDQCGHNVLIEKKRRPVFMLFLDQFKDFMILVLMVAALISGFIGELADTIAILVIVILNAVIGFIQEYRAEKAMAALKNMAAPSAVVLRDNTPIVAPASDLVPGDVALLEAGNVVPADIRLIESVRLEIQEAALTGESVAVEKHCNALPQEDLPLGDRRNMAYKGTTVAYGRGRGVVVATGMHTELGKIAGLLQQEEDARTPLQKRLAQFGKRLAIVVLFICAFIFGVGLLRGEPPMLMLLTAISLAVAAIPEALPAVVTISLALGARKMVAQNVLVRKLSAVETLGSVTYICSDKTGTLTLNQMVVERLYVDGDWMDVKSQTFKAENPLALLMKGIALSNDCFMDADGSLAGDPTEIALCQIARDRGFDKWNLEKQMPRIAEIPFDSERKCMTTFHAFEIGSGSEIERRLLSFTKGAAEIVVDRSDHVWSSDGILPVNRRPILQAAEQMTSEGLRVLGIAVRKWPSVPEDMSSKVVESGLTFLGLVGMMDPPRKEAAEAVAICRKAGIHPVMITGDHPLTAKTIARRLGILDDQTNGILTGSDLETMFQDDFARQVEDVRVYARVAPEQKLGIINALQSRGQFAAMTGDGVNDAPALKNADIGIAMGITGTEVSKEAAHMILLDDNFATIVKAVGEGRKIYDNIRKFIKYMLTSNSGEIWALFLAPLFGLPIPLLPIHILWMNLVTDGLPALALSAEPAEGDVMERPPRPPKEGVFVHGLGVHVLWVGILMAALALGVQYWAMNMPGVHWRTMAFTVLCLNQLGHAMAIRSEKASLFQIGLFSNKYLLGAVILTLALQMTIIYAPFLNPIFKTAPLSGFELILTLGISCVVFVAVEIEKLIRRKSSPRS